MLFLLVIGLFFLAIVFFHFLQGFFSATLSAIFAVVSAVLALSYHETVVEKLLGGKMADYAHALVLLALFAVIYLILRIIFDNVVKGDVRVPAGLNKAGAVVMGIIAAVFATGVMAVAAEELPFNISIGQFARYDVQDDRYVVVPLGRSLDRTEYNELNNGKPGEFGTEGSGHGVPILPVDNILVGAVDKLADGSLSAGKPLESVHADFLDELFGQRMGIEPGASHVAINLPDKHLNAMQVIGLYTQLIPTANQKDAEFAKLRSGGALKPIAFDANKMFLIVRVAFDPQAADQKDRVFRFSPGSARLQAYLSRTESGSPGYVDFYPVGTMQNASTLMLNKPDDYLFVQLSDHPQGVDLVYLVPKRDFEKKAPREENGLPGAFIEVKRLARVDISGEEVKNGPASNPDFNPLRKPLIVEPTPVAETPPAPEPAPAPAPAPTPSPDTPAPTPTPTPAPAAGTSGFQFQQAAISAAVPFTVTAPAGSDGTFVSVPGGTASGANVTGGKLKMANVDSTPAEQTQPMKVTQFVVPEGQAMVQVSGVPAGTMPWQFNNEPDQYELVDSTGKKYQPSGVFAAYTAKGVARLYLRFVDTTTVSGAAPPDDAGPATKVILFYLVPSGTSLTEFDDHGKKSNDVNVTAK